MPKMKTHKGAAKAFPPDQAGQADANESGRQSPAAQEEQQRHQRLPPRRAQ